MCKLNKPNHNLTPFPVYCREFSFASHVRKPNDYLAKESDHIRK